MKKLFTIALLSFAVSANAQTFNDKGNSINDLCTYENYESIEADVNHDGIEDVFIAVKGEGTFAFYFGQKEGGYQLFNHPYYNIFLRDETKITINKKGVLRIQEDHYDGNSDIFLFRFQNGGMYLIGGKKDRHKSDHYDFSYNFSTKEMIKTTGEGSQKTTQTDSMSEIPTLKFGWFPLKWDMLDYLFDPVNDADKKTVLGIFRLMQDQEKMHWAFCDYENQSKDPTGSEGSYSCTNDFTGGTYWVFETLTFTKKSKENWEIKYEQNGGDRVYDEDGGGTNEEDEEESPSTEIFTFEDGIFIFG